jgi:hypothetical protein
MSTFQEMRKTFLSVVSFSLIITFVLLMHVHCAGAQGIGLKGIDTVTLLTGQKADFDVTQSAPFSMHNVGIVSVGNKKLKASLKVGRDQTVQGFWLLLLFGSGGNNLLPLDAGYGLVSADSGKDAEVNTGSMGIGFATGSVFLFSPVSAADPFKYSITIQGVAQ